MFRILLCILLITSLFAEHEEVVTLFLISPGAISQGMGEAMVANNETSLMSYYNPATMSFSSRNRISGTHVNWLPNLATDVYYEFISFNYKLDKKYSIGGHIIYLNLGERIRMDENGNLLYSNKSYALSVAMSFAYRLSTYSAIGFNAKKYKLNEYYNPEKNMWPFYHLTNYTTSNGQVIDFSYYRQKNNLSFGIQLANISSEHSSPINLSFGCMYKLYNIRNSIIKLSFQSDKLLRLQQEMLYKLGIEYSYSNKYYLRMGVLESIIQPSSYSDGGKAINPTYGWGINLWQLGFDFGYTAGEQGHPRANTMHFSLEFQLPKNLD